MTVIRVNRKAEIDERLLKKIKEFLSAEIKDNYLVLTANDLDTITFDLSNLFIHGTIVYESVKDLEFMAFATPTAASLKPFILSISKCFPNLVCSDKAKLSSLFEKAAKLIIARKAESEANPEDYEACTFVEQCDYNNTVNIVSNGDIGVKIDLETGRVFLLCDGMLGLFSENFTTGHESSTIKKLLEELGIDYERS